MKLGALALPKRVSLAVVARDASNPSTGLFAKQQVAGELGCAPRSSLLESDILVYYTIPLYWAYKLAHSSSVYFLISDFLFGKL